MVHWCASTEEESESTHEHRTGTQEHCLVPTSLLVILSLSVVKRFISFIFVTFIMFTFQLQKIKKVLSFSLHSNSVSPLTTSLKLPLAFLLVTDRGAYSEACSWNILCRKSQRWDEPAGMRQNQDLPRGGCDCPSLEHCWCPIPFKFTGAQDLINKPTCQQPSFSHSLQTYPEKGDGG